MVGACVCLNRARLPLSAAPRPLPLAHCGQLPRRCALHVGDALARPRRRFALTRTPVDAAGAADIAAAALKAAEAAGEKIVVHCSGGGGRAPLGAPPLLHATPQLDTPHCRLCESA